ncbi:hypothetical protein HK103_000713 [Boothiomyces macroporosus]|uniref:Uncharacterized protein n=1 Tax=Boothiomyces macroporosus TaxID=261099 RepID=A0AAD5UEK9_9FUNG|nr:hypothetical protein HK103_000713 [Boothiomyces macroporosus]
MSDNFAVTKINEKQVSLQTEQLTKQMELFNEITLELETTKKKLVEVEKKHSALIDASKTQLQDIYHDFSVKEDTLNMQIRNLESRLKKSEASNLELSANLNESTVPLLQQITNLEMKNRELSHDLFNLSKELLDSGKVKEELKVLQVQIKSLQDELELKENSVSELALQISSYEKHVLEKEEKINELVNTIAKIQDEKEGLIKEKEKILEQHKLALESQQSQSSINSDKDEEVKTEKKNREQLRIEIQQERESSASVHSPTTPRNTLLLVGQLQTQLKQTKSRYQLLEVQFQQLQQELDQHKSIINETDIYKTRLSDIEKENEDLKKK